MSKKYFFEDFLLCTHNGLYRGGKVIPLASKELKVLEALINSAGNIVSKEDIISQAWQGGIVSDESLCRCIYVLRRALKMHNQDSVIQTIYGRGYRFMNKVRTESKVSPAKHKNFNSCFNHNNDFFYGDALVDSVNYTVTPWTTNREND